MRRISLMFAAFLALTLALAPALAEARAGYSSSLGSRGSRTYSAPPATSTAPYSAAPFQRSLTPQSPSPSYGGGAFGGASALGGRSPFMSGLMGGLIGAGIGGLLFGHGMFGGIGSFGGFLGFLLQIFLVVMLVRFLLGLFRNRQMAPAGGPGMFARNGAPPSGGYAGGGGSGGGSAQGPAIAITPADYQAFERTLIDIQRAWSGHDLNALQALATPEMVNYFAEQLATQASRDVRNMVTDVKLLQGDLSEAWAEPGRDYASVAMRFSMVDVTRDRSGQVVDGSPSEHVTATEIWTFLRAPGGRWVLSAIQQTR